MLIDAIPSGRLRGRLGSSLWVLCGAGGALEAYLRHGHDLGQAFAMFLIFSLVGFGLGAALVRSVRCPRCGHRLLWARFDDDTGLVADPYAAERCPQCDFEPSPPARG